MKALPVYLFIGFLESGKTKFIQETLEDERFNTGERTLLLLCEEGIEEYEPDMFAADGVHIVTVDSREELTREALKAAAKKVRAERVIIEYNGMWELQTLGEALPDSWQVYQILLTVDSTTFPSYLQNMRQLTVDKLRNAEDVIFNRVTDKTDFAMLHRSVRMVNRRAEMLYEFVDGTIAGDNIKDELPFDLDAEIVEIKDEDFGIWYLDAAENPEKYRGKTLRFRAMACHSQKIPSDCFVPGRFGMTCCVDDIAFVGFICQPGRFRMPEHRSWVTVTVRADVKAHSIYNGDGPWLTLLDIDYSADAPEDELVYFT